MYSHPIEIGKISRRTLLLSPAALGSAAKRKDDPFALGVASGDPLHDRVVIWTRLLVEPGASPIPVQWELAEDEQFRRIVRAGNATATSVAAHSIHVDVAGLRPARWYWYRFTAAGRRSPTGRTRTAHDPRSTDPLRFAFASCQKYEDGYFTAFEHMAAEDLHLVIHLGDYIYEGACGRNKIRLHDEPVCMTLDHYRRRYELYKRDPALQRVHALFPWAAVWDDHETADNYAGFIPDHDSPRDTFRERRAAAYQAYYEHMPIRPRPRGPDLPLYRELRFGAAATVLLLDTRQYRSDQPCGDRLKPPCAERETTAMLGDAQERWLQSRLRQSPARWNVLAQQVLMAQLDCEPGPGEKFPMDKWDGYPAARRRLLAFLREAHIANPLVLTGDNHNNWVFDLREDFNRPETPPVATEFAGTSITSNSDGADVSAEYGAALRSNAHIRYHDSRRGYVSCRLDANQCIAHYRQVPFVTRPGAPLVTKASFAVEAGRPGAVRL